MSKIKFVHLDQEAKYIGNPARHLRQAGYPVNSIETLTKNLDSDKVADPPAQSSTQSV